jgi:LytS/YehU family sensor histidine kinase
MQHTSKALKITPPFWKTWWFWGLIILCITCGVYLQFQQKVKKALQQEALQKRIAETKLEALQSQMNPHFTFNAMSSIQNYVIDNDIDKALMYIGEFAKLMRRTLDNSSETYISLREEIEYLNGYILLENMRFDNSINVNIETNELSLDDEYIPPMLIQPLIENSFNHAFNNSNGKHKLTIGFNKNNGVISITVTDNGCGIQNTQMQHTSKALKIIKERLHLINNNTETDFITINSSKSGTTTTITIPK